MFRSDKGNALIWVLERMKLGKSTVIVLKRLALWVSILSIWCPIYAASPISISDAQEEYAIGRSLQILRDPTGNLTLDDVRSSKASGSWQASTSDEPNYGFLDDAVWLKFTVVNHSQSQTQWFLEVNYPLLNHIELYRPNGLGGYSKTLTGDHHHFDTREIDYRNFSFTLDLPYAEERTFYLRAKSDTLLFPMKISSPKSFSEKKLLEAFGYGGYYGLMLVMVLYNLFIYFSVRDINYIYYSLYISSYIVFQFSVTGFSFQFLWPSHPHWANVNIAFFMGTSLFWLLMFSRRFLETKKISPLSDKIFAGLMYFALFVAVFSLILPYGPMIKMANIMSLVNSIAVLFQTTIH